MTRLHLGAILTLVFVAVTLLLLTRRPKVTTFTVTSPDGYNSIVVRTDRTVTTVTDSAGNQWRQSR